jgi:transposase-like protein
MLPQTGTTRKDSVVADPKNRGARDILIACCDGLAGFGDAITGAFPRTVVRICVVRYAGVPVVPASRRELVAIVLRVAGRPA